MPSLAEFDAARKGQMAPTGAVSPDENTMPTSLGDAYAPGQADTPDSAFIHELMRTGKEAGIGLLRSPLDLVKNTANTIIHPLDTLMGIGRTLAHPVDAAMELAKNPREAGSLLGQTLLAPRMPEAVNTALAEGPGIVGRGISAVGRGAEVVGTSKVLKSANRYGAIGTALSGHPGLAALELAAPPALEYGGRLAQRGGAALEGLDLAYKGKIPTPFARAADVEEVDPAAVMREKVAGAREDVEAGFSRKVASKLNGLDSSATDVSHPTAEVAGAGDLFPYQKDVIDGLRGARNTQSLVDVPDIYDNPWENDLSAVKPTTLSDSPSFKGLQDSVRRSNQKPIENFYEDNPQARVGGEGRMTGQFEEGAGGLSDIASGNFTRNAVVSPTDARLTSMDMPPDAGMPADFFDEGLRPLAETGRPTTLSLDALSRLVRSGKGAVR